MAFPARFATVKPAVEVYEQRLKGVGKHSEEVISTLIEKAGMEVEGSDVVVVEEELRAAAAALEDFIYGREVDKAEGEGEAMEGVEEKTGESAGEVRGEDAGEKVVGETGVNEGEAVEEKDEEKGAAKASAETQAGEDQEMKEGPADA